MTFDDVLGFVLWIVLLAFGAAVVETWWERRQRRNRILDRL